ncbi:MAG TPA: MarR family transcriptional regulator [Rhodospirillales bacterium]|nr:MarR family transcriptional regulator [Rhodospirillales bacterium]
MNEGEGGTTPHDERTAELLRLWLRLLGTATSIERELAQRMRQRFGCSLARFDLLAQLAKSRQGLTMGELSRRLMVTNGNVTGLVRRLVEEGLVVRESDPDDRRLQRVRLTADGLALFGRMAVVHGRWVTELLGDLDREERRALSALLARVKAATMQGRDDRGAA